MSQLSITWRMDESEKRRLMLEKISEFCLMDPDEFLNMVGQWQDGFQESRPPSEVSLIESDPPEPPEPEPEPEPPQTPPEPTEVKISAEAKLKPGELKTKGIMGHNRTFHLHEYSYYEGKHLKGTSVLTCLCTSKGCTGRLYLNEIRKTYQVRSHDHEPFDQGAD